MGGFGSTRNFLILRLKGNSNVFLRTLKAREATWRPHVDSYFLIFIYMSAALFHVGRLRSTPLIGCSSWGAMQSTRVPSPPSCSSGDGGRVGALNGAGCSFYQI